MVDLTYARAPDDPYWGIDALAEWEMLGVIKVFIADDHPALWVGLRVLLDQAPDMEVVGEAEDGIEALAMIEKLRPDVAVLDCKLPGLSGPQVATALREKGLPSGERAKTVEIYSLQGSVLRGMLKVLTGQSRWTYDHRRCLIQSN